MFGDSIHHRRNAEPTEICHQFSASAVVELGVIYSIRVYDVTFGSQQSTGWRLTSNKHGVRGVTSRSGDVPSS